MKSPKSLILLVLSLTALSLSACGSGVESAVYSGEPGLPGEDFDFARSHWGDSLDEVSSKYSGENFFLYTTEELFGLPVEAIHSFAPNDEDVPVLVQGNYKFIGQYVKENGADLFGKLLAELTDKYGSPNSLMCFDGDGNDYDSVEDMISASDGENINGRAQAIWRYSESAYTSVVLDGSFKEEDNVAIVIAAPR